MRRKKICELEDWNCEVIQLDEYKEKRMKEKNGMWLI